MIERLEFGAGAPYSASELGIHVARYGLVARLCGGRRILDVACGTGFGSYLMVERWGAASVDAVDVSTEAIASAREFFDHPRITWHEMDADALDSTQFAEPFDLIVSFETIEHLENPEGFLRALKTLAKPDGVIVVSCPNDRWYFGRGSSKNVWHKHTYTFAEFKAQTEAVLGAAHSYFLGSTVGGFSNVRLSVHGSQPAKLLDGFRRVKETDAVLVPSLLSTEPTVDQSLYFVGVWGSVAPEENAAVVPVSPEHRFAVESLRPEFIRQDRVKPRVVLVADVPGWAYDNIAQQIRSHLNDIFDIEVVYAVDYGDWVACIHDIVDVRQVDLVHFFWREYLFAILAGNPARRVREHYGVPEQDFLKLFVRLVVTTSVYDHLYLDEASIEERSPLLAYVDAYSVSSAKLYDVYVEKYETRPEVVIEDGVDLALFLPAARGRREHGEGEIVVGWAGNSDWNRTETWDPKGLHTVLEPALAKLQAEGVRIRGHFIDSSARVRPRAEMPSFYGEIDIYVCVSEIEGTPNPVLEAMACGVPVVSTDVGIVRQVFGPEQQRFILPDRNVDTVVAALRALADDPELRRRLAAENLAAIRGWSWGQGMPKWLQLFKAASQRRRSILRFAEVHMQRMQEEVRRKDEILVAAERLAEERWQSVQKMEAVIAERDTLVGDQARRVAALERQLEYAQTLRGALGRVADSLRPVVGPLLVLLWPLALLLVNSNWIFTNPYVPSGAKPWEYVGYFHFYPDYVRVFPASGPGQGLPWLLAGYAVYQALPWVLANYALHLAVYVVGALAVFLTVRELFGGRGAVLSTLWMGSYAGFLMAVGWDWVDGAAIAYALVATYCLTRAGRRRSWRTAVVVAGAATAAMLTTYALTAVLVPALWFYFVPLNRRFEAHPLGAASALFAAGAVGLILVLGTVNYLMGAPFFFAQNQLWIDLESPVPGIVPGGQAGRGWVSVGPCSALPLAVMFGCIPWAAPGWFARFMGKRGEQWADSDEGFLSKVLSVQYVYTTLAFLALHWLIQPVLANHYHTSVLIPGMMLVVGAFFARILRDLPRIQYATVVSGAAGLFAIPLIPWVGTSLRTMLVPGAGQISAVVPASIVLTGLAAVWLLRMNLVSALLFCVCASIANATVADEPQFSVSQDRDRTEGFLAITEAAQVIQAANADGRLGMWMDQEETPLGPNVFDAIWMTAHMEEAPFRSREFSRVDPTASEATGRIALLSARPDAQAVADAALRRAGMEPCWLSARTVRRGNLRFEIRIVDVACERDPSVAATP